MPIKYDLSQELLSTYERQLNGLEKGPFSIRPPNALHKAVAVVEKKFGYGVTDGLTTDRLRRALARLKEGGAGSLSRGDRFVLAHRFAEVLPEYGDKPVLFVIRLSDGVLKQWEMEASSGDLRATHWRGLFHSFLQAPEGRPTERLKGILARGFETLGRRRSVRRPWLDVLRRHQGLLGRAPCAPYVSELLEGERGLLQDLQSAIAVPPHSWFWRALIEEFVVQLRECSDSDFLSRIAVGLDLAGELPLSHDLILGAILDRYARCRNRVPHQKLLHYSMEKWGSPQLDRNARWSQVRNETLAMVRGWLAQEDLEDFYRLCQDARQVDEDRLRYWLRFRDQISFTQIVLGRALHASRDHDMRVFRERKRGRLGVLLDASDNNAMVLQIGTLVFVEFSARGNACYPYRNKHVPFELGTQHYAIHDLKNKPRVEASRLKVLIHQPGWETKVFDPALRDWGVAVGDARKATPRRP